MRLPLVPTLMVAVMVPVMVGLGIWQLQRAEWKAGLLAELEAARTLPEVDLDLGPPDGAVSFRRALVTCTSAPGKPVVAAGRSRSGVSGYSYRARCRDDVMVDMGWAPRPDAAMPPAQTGRVSGTVLEAPLAGSNAGARYLVYADNAAAPLEPSAPPSTETIPNNHTAYAVQWFLFAAAMCAVYGIYVRRRTMAAKKLR